MPKLGALFVAVLLTLVGAAACNVPPSGLLRPNAVAIAPDNTIYVMDRGNYRIVHMKTNGEVIETFGKLGIERNDVFSGWDVELDHDGNIYICNFIIDQENTSQIIHDGIKVFSSNGSLLREIGGNDYTEEDDPYEPYDLDIDKNGTIYVGNFTTNSMRIFSHEGTLINEIFGEEGDGPGEFRGLSGITIDNTRDYLYITDFMNSRVQQFFLYTNASGVISATHIANFGSYGRDPGQFSYPQGIAVDEESGDVYVSDMGNRRVQVFSTDGEFLMAFHRPGVQDWQILGLIVAPDRSIYVADALNNVIWVFDRQGRVQNRIEVRL